MATCTICDSRKGKRYCTARGEDICAQCCATEREVSINCPHTCRYLIDARLHERYQVDTSAWPYPAIEVNDAPSENSQIVLTVFEGLLYRAVRPHANATDADVRQALDALIAPRLPEPVAPPELSETAAAIRDAYQASIDSFLAEVQDRENSQFSADAVIAILIYLVRSVFARDNHRPRCRAYVHYLREHLEPIFREQPVQ